MKALRYIFALGLVAGAWAGVHAQGIDAFKRRLSMPDTLYRSRVQVIEHGSAEQTLRYLQARHSDERIRGYRVRIFSDNSQRARTDAAGTAARFQELFPGIPVYMAYENPYWKVTVGNCATSEEAIILMGRIRGSFDRAFLMQEQIPIHFFAE